MKIMSFNANGIRSAARKGFFPWLATQDVDIVCIQELRAQEGQFPPPPEGYHCFYASARRKGYSGTAMYCRRSPQGFSRGRGWEPLEEEGRWVQADYPHWSVVSFYMPSGSASPERQQQKFVFMERMERELRRLRADGREYIICADWNICHKEIDLENWRANSKNSGFLPEERAWVDMLLGELGFIDAFRVVNSEARQYTWWSNRGRAWEKNVGWRLDYQLITPGLREHIRSASIYRQQRFSDHAPLIMEYSLEY